MSWTDDRVERLTKMWNEGQSASQIAKDLGGVTRNAVIGKVHRLGLSNRTATEAEPAPAASPEPVRGPAPAAETAPEAPADPPAVEVAEDRLSEDRPSENPPSETRIVEVAPSPRRQIVPAGQPLPPQPSANEISPEALETVREVEKKSKRLTLMDLTERTCKWPIGDPAGDNFWFCGLGVQSGKPYCEAHVGVAFQPMSSRRDRRR